jgi:hypothetical protein
LNVTKEEEEGNMVISLGVEKRNRGESIVRVPGAKF